LTVLAIPSPSTGVWYLGPVPIRGYALAIILGIVAAIWIGERRWVARGGRPGEIQDLAIWAVPFGLVGGRLYHVLTDGALYFGADGNAIEALYVWRGGLGVWGAIAFGALGVVIGAKRKGIKLLPVLDAMAPGVLVAQAIGRWGNWFNQELFGKPTDLPWALEIDPEHRPVQYAFDPTFHPTFLYEALYSLIGVGLLIWIGARFRIKPPGLFALYVAYYTFGRTFEELLRVDPSHEFFGLRLNAYVSIVLFVVSVSFFVWWQFLRDRDEGEPRDGRRARRSEPPAPREKLAVPKGRVRPSR
jgi:phosphatidylglycerol---prolipoprotein diacylglyceryl transferase